MNEKLHDCRTCKYGWADDHWGIPFCHRGDCVKWELWEPKEENDEEASCVKKILSGVEDCGEWTDIGSLSCRCSKCGCKNNRPTSYCPACGKKMRLYDRFIDASQ